MEFLSLISRSEFLFLLEIFLENFLHETCENISKHFSFSLLTVSTTSWRKLEKFPSEKRGKFCVKEKLANDLLRKGEENVFNYRPTGNDGAEWVLNIIKCESVHLITLIDS